MSGYFLSKIELNARKRGARRLLMSPQAMHAAVEASLPPSARQPGRRFLWRLDTFGMRNDLYVVSPGEPDFGHLVEQGGWERRGGKEWISKPYGRLLSQLEAGQTWVFRLAANPTHRGRTATGEKKLFGHVTWAQQTEWLLQRAAANGFSIPLEANRGPAVDIVGRKDLRFKRGSEGASVTIRQATFEGLLQVEDPDLLRAALTGGIGRAKAYGCGLMTLAPVQLSAEREPLDE